MYVIYIYIYIYIRCMLYIYKYPEGRQKNFTKICNLRTC